jgi:hypothetical protein
VAPRGSKVLLLDLRLLLMKCHRLVHKVAEVMLNLTFLRGPDLPPTIIPIKATKVRLHHQVGVARLLMKGLNNKNLPKYLKIVPRVEKRWAQKI